MDSNVNAYTLKNFDFFGWSGCEEEVIISGYDIG